MNDIGKFIRLARDRLGLSLQAFADRVGVSKTLLWKWENRRQSILPKYLSPLGSTLELDSAGITKLKLLISGQKPITTPVRGADDLMKTLRKSFDSLSEIEQQSLVLELDDAMSRWKSSRKKGITRCICPFAGWQADYLGFKQRERIAQCIAGDAADASLVSIHFVVREGEDKQFQQLKQEADIKIRFNNQSEQLGTAHAVLQGLPLNTNEPFAVFFPDDRISPLCMQDMLDNYYRDRRSIIAIRRLKKRENEVYGTVEIEKRTGNICKVVAATDDPGKSNEKGQFVIVGRYLFEPRVVRFLKNSLTDTISTLARQDPGVSGYIVPDEEFETIVQARAVVTEGIDDFVDWSSPTRKVRRQRSKSRRVAV